MFLSAMEIELLFQDLFNFQKNTANSMNKFSF